MMERDEFRQRLAALGYTCQDFAALSGYSAKTVCDFGARTAIPHIVRNYLTALEVLSQHGLPLPVDISGPAHREPINGRAAKLLRAAIDTF